jgi:hypothetical protein
MGEIISKFVNIEFNAHKSLYQYNKKEKSWRKQTSNWEENNLGETEVYDKLIKGQMIVAIIGFLILKVSCGDWSIDH